jgi:hypothetical protein
MDDSNIPNSIDVTLTSHETLAVSIALDALGTAYRTEHGKDNPIITELMAKIGKAVDEQVIAHMTPEQIADGHEKMDEMLNKAQADKFRSQINNGLDIPPNG